MSTIKSDSENLTLNAHGSGNDIKFQSNSVEVGSISDAGLMTATLFAGSGASLTALPAAQITGTLPAISGANLTSLPSLPLAGGTLTGDLNLGDNVDINFGAAPDLKIFHDGSDSYIQDLGDGELRLETNGTTIRLRAGSDTLASFVKDGASSLRYDGSTKIETTSAGISVGGTQDINKADTTFATNLATTASAATFKVKTHSGDSTITTFGGITGGVGYIQRSNGGGTASYFLSLNPYGGGVLIGQAAAAEATGGCEIQNSGTILCTREAGPAAIMRRNGGTGEIIRLDDSGVTVGTISTSGSNTSYNTSSDYRLKENVDYTWDATTRLKQLKPARFNFIVDDTNTLVDGFLAHEVSSIVSEAITGEKDAVDDDGNPVHQGIDQSKLVPLLVKTIQELEARITALES